MGEIAEALRRATTGGSSVVAPGRRPPRPATQAPQAPSVHRPEPAALDGPPMVEELRPLDPAVIVDDGPQLEKCRHLALRLRKELDLRGARSLAVTSGMAPAAVVIGSGLK